MPGTTAVQAWDVFLGCAQNIFRSNSVNWRMTSSLLMWSDFVIHYSAQ